MKLTKVVDHVQAQLRARAIGRDHRGGVVVVLVVVVPLYVVVDDVTAVQRTSGAAAEEDAVVVRRRQAAVRRCRGRCGLVWAAVVLVAPEVCGREWLVDVVAPGTAGAILVVCCRKFRGKFKGT